MTKIDFTEKNGIKHENGFQIAYQFRLIDSIIKSHFRALMLITRCYDSKSKIGFIEPKNAGDFLILVYKIEKSSSKIAKKSHEKAKEKYSSVETKTKLTFEDYCEDYLDMHSSLMNESQRNEAYASYRNLK